MPEIHDAFAYGTMQFDFPAFPFPIDNRPLFRTPVPFTYIFELALWRGDPFGQYESIGGGGIGESGQGNAWLDFFWHDGWYYFDHGILDLTDLTAAGLSAASPAVEVHTPEPSTLALCGLGLTALTALAAGRRRKDGRSVQTSCKRHSETGQNGMDKR